jgi:hypothetical protein
MSQIISLLFIPRCHKSCILTMSQIMFKLTAFTSPPEDDTSVTQPCHRIGLTTVFGIEIVRYTNLIGLDWIAGIIPGRRICFLSLSSFTNRVEWNLWDQNYKCFCHMLACVVIKFSCYKEHRTPAYGCVVSYI